ncbi:MAG TPA: flagellar hook-basal body complex protein [Burkholderiaceae bacterium]|nr:flagellar hook-basal body complex protein [Burkholderiaceae bacterium]
MFESMYIGISGLSAYSRGLNVISNNLANMNTTGFKGSTLNFGDLFYRQQSSGGDASSSGSQLGTGVHVLGTHMNFRAGELRQTGNALDLAITGNGYLVTRDAHGKEQRYSRAGQLAFDRDGILVSSTTGRRIAGLDAAGALTDVTLNGLRINPPVATTSVVLQGILSNTQSTTGTQNEFTLTPIKVIDSLGGEHTLKAVFTSSSANSGTWNVVVRENTVDLATGTVRFINGVPDPAASSISVAFAPANAASMTFNLTLGPNASSFSVGTSSTLAVASQDGVAVGSLVSAAIDADGFVVATYSNGKTQKGTQLALASVAADSALAPAENGEFTLSDSTGLVIGRAGQNGLGKFSAGQVEGSNVDLATQFTDLIVMQRGYQASSRIVSTANDLIQELFDMKGHR